MAQRRDAGGRGSPASASPFNHVCTSTARIVFATGRLHGPMTGYFARTRPVGHHQPTAKLGRVVDLSCRCSPFVSWTGHERGIRIRAEWSGVSTQKKLFKWRMGCAESIVRDRLCPIDPPVRGTVTWCNGQDEILVLGVLSRYHVFLRQLPQ